MAARTETGSRAQLTEVDSLPASTTKFFSQSPANEVVDRWVMNGDFTLFSLKAFATNGISASALGVFTFKIIRVTEGDPAFIETVLQTRDINTGGRPLLDQIITEMVVGSGYEFQAGEQLMVAIESDNLDLTGGAGISVTPFWLRTTEE